MRLILILTPFLLAIGGLVFLQAGVFQSDTQTQATATNPDQIPLTEIENVIAQLPAQAQGVSTSSATADESEEMRSLTNSILGNLGVEMAQDPASTQIDPENQEIRALTNSILFSLGYSDGDSSADEVTQSTSELASSVNAALNAGQSDAEINDLINSYINQQVQHATASGAIQVPETFVTEDGRVDTASLIAAVSTGTRQSETLIPAALTPVALTETTVAANGKRYYLVEVGDSLASIALRFYGDVDHVRILFQVNRALLPTPNMIKVGQKLHIPG